MSLMQCDLIFYRTFNMASSSNRTVESVDESQAQYNVVPHPQGGNEELLPDLNHPRVSGNEMGSNSRAMSHNTPFMTPPFQQMAEFFRHLARTMSEPSEMNFEKMRKMGGVEFEGTTDPTVAEQWLEHMERVFEQLECTNAAKFKYAISLLQKDAYDWWVSVPNAKAKPPVLTWDDFVKSFRAKYVPPIYCDAKKKEFLNLKQGSMSIAEYQQNFLRLSPYAKGIIDGERDKCRRFEEGLNGYIRKSVAIFQLEDFSKLISAALTWERIDKEEASRRENRFRKGNSDYGGPSKKGKFDYFNTESTHKSLHHKQNKSNFSTASTPSYAQGKTHTPTCAQCGKNHYGACRRASSACFNCGSMDHKVKDCPNPNPLSYTHTEGSVQKPITTHSQANGSARPRNMQAAGSSVANQAGGSRAAARVYAMRQKNDQDGPDVVAGKFHLFGISVVTLFDPGSSHSYVCSSLAFPDTVKSVRVDFDVLVTSPLGHQAVVNRIYRDCPFMIQNLVFLVDLLEIPFRDYDVIIGMDWLHRHHALVDCRLKQVTFRTPAYSHMVVQGETSLSSNIISAVLARKMICQGCDAYLAHIVDTRLRSPSLKDIPTVCDFPDVFPDDLPGLPPEREIEFPIDLVPGTTLISIAPYRTAPAELKELKAQLQELLEKGFIRPSISP
ncbi:uncharacterized protein [Nicotiana sylvestris]|uniref:uncharacterized protein n=1 Tax=Nicotiana sylvestris TaxID=4096 RepID=UPI00388C7442